MGGLTRIFKACDLRPLPSVHAYCQAVASPPPAPHDRYLNHTLASIRRTKLLFFAGMTETPFHSKQWPFLDAGYSGGVRQTVLRLYGEDPRFSLHRDGAKMPDYYERMAASTFCLAPQGVGWGARV